MPSVLANAGSDEEYSIKFRNNGPASHLPAGTVGGMVTGK